MGIDSYRNLQNGNGPVRVYVRNAQELKGVRDELASAKRVVPQQSKKEVLGGVAQSENGLLSAPLTFKAARAYDRHKDSFRFFREGIGRLLPYSKASGHISTEKKTVRDRVEAGLSKVFPSAHKKEFTCVTIQLKNGKVEEAHVSSNTGAGLRKQKDALNDQDFKTALADLNQSAA